MSRLLFSPPLPLLISSGDFFYIDVRTLEGNVHYITAWTNGFYVNNTKQGGAFDPLPAPNAASSHELPELLSKLSGKFREAFKRQLEVAFDPMSFDYIPAQLPVPISWLAQKEEHRYDPNRAEDASVRFYNTDIMYVHPPLLLD